MTGREADRQLRHRQQLRFALRFGALSLIGFTTYAFPYEPGAYVDRLMNAYLAGYARLAGSVLSWVEPRVSVNGTIIVGRVALEIVRNCDAMDVMLLFGAATLALDGSVGARLFALGAGTCAILVLNIVRISSLYFVRRDFPGAFETVHLEIWPPLMVAATAWLFLALSKWLAVRAWGADHAS